MNPQSNDRFLACQRKLYRFSLSLSGNRDDAQDLYQNVLLKIWQMKDQWGSWQNFEAYAMQLVKNTFLNYIKKNNQRQRIPLDEVVELPAINEIERQIVLDDLKLRFMHLISKLPETQRDVIFLREIEEMEYNEISEILGISLAQVKVSLFRARQCIKTKNK